MLSTPAPPSPTTPQSPPIALGSVDLAFLDSVPTAIFVHDASGQPYFANRPARALFGVGADPAAPMSLVAAAAEIYVTDTDTRYPLESFPATMPAGVVDCRLGDMEIRRLDGTVHLEVWVKQTLNHDGTINCTVHSFVDASERKNTDADLLLTESLTKAVATAPGFADVLETSLHEICQLTGWSFGQAWLPDSTGTSMRCKYTWHEDSVGFREFHRASRALVVKPGEGLAGRVWVSKQWEWNDDEAAPVADDVAQPSDALVAGHRASVAMPVVVDDKVVAVLEFLVLVGGNQDQRSVDRVTSVVSRVGLWMSTKGAEDAGRRGEDKFRQIAEATADAIIFASADSRILYMNPAAETLFGYTADEVIGLLMAELVHDRVHPVSDATIGRFAHVRASGVAGPPVYLMAVRRSGEEFPVEMTITSWQEGKETFLTAIVRDSSDRVRTELKLRETLGLERKAHEQLQVLDALKYTVLQAVAHDLRSPIAAVLILTGILRADAKELAPALRLPLLADIERSMGKMGRLLQDLLDSDPAQPIEARRKPCDVGELVRRTLADSALDSSRPVYTDLASVVINVDAAQIDRIVENLLTNAAKHLVVGVPVWVRTTHSDGGALIVVEDAGEGVPADLREEIFEPFRRGNEPAMHSLGLGLGLSLVSRFAVLHGGRAWVEDREGGGASFRVFLPDTGATPREL